jgi:hypothetical protein
VLPFAREQCCPGCNEGESVVLKTFCIFLKQPVNDPYRPAIELFSRNPTNNLPSTSDQSCGILRAICRLALAKHKNRPLTSFFHIDSSLKMYN